MAKWELQFLFAIYTSNKLPSHEKPCLLYVSVVISVRLNDARFPYSLLVHIKMLEPAIRNSNYMHPHITNSADFETRCFACSFVQCRKVVSMAFQSHCTKLSKIPVKQQPGIFQTITILTQDF